MNVLAQAIYAWLVPIDSIVFDDEPHQDYVNDPAHYDEAGHYLWWGC